MFKERNETIAFISETHLAKQFGGDISNWVFATCGDKSYKQLKAASNKDEAIMTAFHTSKQVGVCAYKEVITEDVISQRIRELEKQEDVLLSALKALDKEKLINSESNELRIEEIRLERKLRQVDLAMSNEWSRFEKTEKHYALVAY